MLRRFMSSMWMLAVGATATSGLVSPLPLSADEPVVNEPVVVVAQVDAPRKSASADVQADADADPGTTETDVAPPQRLWLGIALKAVEGDLATYLKRSDGVMVARVLPDSPAAKAKLEEGDILLSIAGHKLGSPSELQTIISELKSDSDKPTKLDVTLLRNGQEMELQIAPEPVAAAKFQIELSVDSDGKDNEKQLFEWKSELPNEEVRKLLEKIGDGKTNRELNIFRFGNPSLRAADRTLKGTMQLRIEREVDGKPVEILIDRVNDQPAKIKIVRAGKVSEFSEAELDKLPKEILVIVEPILDGNLQNGVSIQVDASGSSDTKPTWKMELDRKELAEKYRSRAVEIAEQARSSADAARQQARELAKVAQETAERSIQGAISLPKEMKELRSLVDELRQEMKQLRAELESTKAEK